MVSHNKWQPADSSNDIDAICDDFDQRWSKSDQPNIAEYLKHNDSAIRDVILSMLIPIDIEYRVRNAEKVIPFQANELHSIPFFHGEKLST